MNNLFSEISHLEMAKDVCLHQTKETGEKHNLVIKNPVNGKFNLKEGSSYEVIKASETLENSILVYTSDELLKEETQNEEFDDDLIL